MSSNAFPLILFMIVSSVSANLLMKRDADRSPSDLDIFAWIGPWGLLGLGCFFLSALAYTRVLQILPLNVAQSFLAAQFVGVILAAAAILGEPIGGLRWLGIGLIAAGILVVAFGDAARGAP